MRYALPAGLALFAALSAVAIAVFGLPAAAAAAAVVTGYGLCRMSVWRKPAAAAAAALVLLPAAVTGVHALSPRGRFDATLAALVAAMILAAAAVASVVSLALLKLFERLAVSTLGSRRFVPMMAWRFLRSQRQVPTWGTRRVRALRKLIPSGPDEPAARVVVEAAIAAALVAAAYGLAPGDDLPRFAARTLLPACVAAWLAARSLAGPARFAPVRGIAAMMAGGLFLYGVTASGPFLAMPEVLRHLVVPVAAAGFVPVAAQIAHRTLLLRRRRRGTLPPELDLSLSPIEQTRLRHGVGASVFVSVVGVAIGVWALTVVLSVMGGFSGELEQRIVKTRDHVMVKASDPAAGLADALGLARRIASLPGVETASPYVEGEAMMSSSVNISATVTVRGVDRRPDALRFLEPVLISGSTEFFRRPEELIPFPGVREAEETTLLPALSAMPPLPAPAPGGVSPMPPIAAPAADGVSPMPPIAAPAAGHATLRPVIIGQELARSLAASVGSRITVISPDGDVGPMGVQPRARPFTVAAIFATGMYEYDLKFAYMYLPDAQDFFNLGDTVDHLDVRLADLAATDAVWPRVSELAGPGAQVLTWKEMNRNLLSALELERVVMFVVLGFIILIASFNIVTSLVILIRRRLSAIAIMKTSGASSGQVTRVFFLLGSAIGLIGILSGIIMGLSACAVLSHLGLTLPKEFYIRRLPVQVDPWQVALIAAVALTVIALASLYPGRLAARVSVVEGLKDER